MSGTVADGRLGIGIAAASRTPGGVPPTVGYARHGPMMPERGLRA